MDFKITYYKNNTGRKLVEEFLVELGRSNPPFAKQAFKGIEKLRNKSYHQEPLSKFLEPGLWELRIKSGNNILRVLYTFKKGRIIILLHIFISDACELTLFKKQQKILVHDLELVRKRLKEIA